MPTITFNGQKDLRDRIFRLVQHCTQFLDETANGQENQPACCKMIEALMSEVFGPSETLGPESKEEVPRGDSESGEASDTVSSQYKNVASVTDERPSTAGCRTGSRRTVFIIDQGRLDLLDIFNLVRGGYIEGAKRYNPVVGSRDFGYKVCFSSATAAEDFLNWSKTLHAHQYDSKFRFVKVEWARDDWPVNDHLIELATKESARCRIKISNFPRYLTPRIFSSRLRNVCNEYNISFFAESARFRFDRPKQELVLVFESFTDSVIFKDWFEKGRLGSELRNSKVSYIPDPGENLSIPTPAERVAQLKEMSSRVRVPAVNDQNTPQHSPRAHPCAINVPTPSMHNQVALRGTPVSAGTPEAVVWHEGLVNGRLSNIELLHAALVTEGSVYPHLKAINKTLNQRRDHLTGQKLTETAGVDSYPVSRPACEVKEGILIDLS